MHETNCECQYCFTLGNLRSQADFGFGNMIADFPKYYPVRRGEEKSDFLGLPDLIYKNKILILLSAAASVYFFFKILRTKNS